MATDARSDVSRILSDIEAGHESAKEQLLQVAYEELRALAGGLMRRERPDHTLQPTALVHEAALRILRGEVLGTLHNRAAFFGAMATAMRRVLVDHARRRRAQRRSGRRERVPLDDVVETLESTHKLDLLVLDEALGQLEGLSRRQSEVVVRRFFGGFEIAEVAEHLQVSVSTVEKDWRIARAWLRQRLAEGGHDS